MRSDGTMYKGFYDRQLVVTVTSEAFGGGSNTLPEDKQIIPDDNVLDYEYIPSQGDRLVKIIVCISHVHIGATFEINDMSTLMLR